MMEGSKLGRRSRWSSQWIQTGRKGSESRKGLRLEKEEHQQDQEGTKAKSESRDSWRRKG